TICLTEMVHVAHHDFKSAPASPTLDHFQWNRWTNSPEYARNFHRSQLCSALLAKTVIEQSRCRAADRSDRFAPAEITAVRPGVLFPGRDGMRSTWSRSVAVKASSIYRDSSP